VFEAGRQTRISQPLDCGRNIVLTGKGKKKKLLLRTMNAATVYVGFFTEK